MNITTPIYLVAYFLIAIIVSVEAYYRGHNFFWVLLLTLFITPLLGAIMFSHYKPDEFE
ncbi:MAG: hypothetical protein ABI675_19525 [Chitinophagaceae bacterium]